MTNTNRDNLKTRAKNMIGFIKAVAETKRELSTMGSFLMQAQSRTLHTVKGYQIVKSDKFMKINGMMIAMALITDNKESVILVDDLFDTLSKDAQEFTLYHEVGHLMMSEGLDIDKSLKVKTKERNECSKKGFIYPEEKIADDYAISMMGREKSVAALKEIAQVLNSYRLITKDKELDLRIKNAMNYTEQPVSMVVNY